MPYKFRVRATGFLEVPGLAILILAALLVVSAVAVYKLL